MHDPRAPCPRAQTKLVTQQAVELKTTKENIEHWYATSPMEFSYEGLSVVYALEYDAPAYFGFSRERKLETLTNLIYLSQPRTDSIAHHFQLRLAGQLKPDKSVRARAAVLLESILTNCLRLPALDAYTLINFLDKAGVMHPNDLTNACTRPRLEPRFQSIWQECIL